MAEKLRSSSLFANIPNLNNTNIAKSEPAEVKTPEAKPTTKTEDINDFIKEENVKPQKSVDNKDKTEPKVTSEKEEDATDKKAIKTEPEHTTELIVDNDKHKLTTEEERIADMKKKLSDPANVKVIHVKLTLDNAIYLNSAQHAANMSSTLYMSLLFSEEPPEIAPADAFNYIQSLKYKQSAAKSVRIPMDIYDNFKKQADALALPVFAYANLLIDRKRQNENIVS